MKNKLFRSSLHYFSAQIANKAQAFISIPIFTRLLSPGEYGFVNVYQSIFAIFIILASFNLHKSIGRYYYEEKNDFPAFLATNFIAIIASVLFFIILLMLSSQLLSASFEMPVILIHLMGFAILFNVTKTIYETVLITSKRSSEYTILVSLTSYFGLALSIILVLYFSDLKYFYRLLGGVVAVILVATYSSFKLYPIMNFKGLKWEYLKYSWSYSVPLIPYALSGILLGTLDRVILNIIKDSTETGLYSLAYNVGMITMVVVVSANQAFLPHFFTWMNEGKKDIIARNQKRILIIVSLFTLGLTFFSKEIITILSDKSFHEAIYLVPIISAGYLFYSVANLGNHYFAFYKNTGILALINILAGVLNVVLNVVFIPKFGKEAAAYTTLFCYICLAISNFMIIRKRYGKETLNISIFVIPLIITISGFLLFLISFYINFYVYSLIFRLLVYTLLMIYGYKNLRANVT